MESLKFLAPALAVVALLFAFYKIAFVSKQDAGTERMKEISAAINGGAKAFLFAEYKILAIFVVVLFIAIGLGLGSWRTACLSSGVAATGRPFPCRRQLLPCPRTASEAE